MTWIRQLNIRTKLNKNEIKRKFVSRKDCISKDKNKLQIKKMIQCCDRPRQEGKK